MRIHYSKYTTANTLQHISIHNSTGKYTSINEFTWHKHRRIYVYIHVYVCAYITT